MYKLLTAMLTAAVCCGLNVASGQTKPQGSPGPSETQPRQTKLQGPLGPPVAVEVRPGPPEKERVPPEKERVLPEKERVLSEKERVLPEKERVAEPASAAAVILTGQELFDYWDGKTNSGKPPLGVAKTPGGRTDRRMVAFKPKFSAPPKVAVAINRLDVDNKSHTRVEAYTTNVTASGFELIVGTWQDSIVYQIGVNWFAIGK